LKTKSLREVNLSHPIKMNEIEKMRPGSLLSVSVIRSPPHLESEWALASTFDSRGCIRFFEIDSETVEENMRNWKQMMGFPDPRNANVDSALKGLRDGEGKSDPRFGVDKPKHGKEDEKNEPHVGGNTWAGGTGGSDTAGLGGRGGRNAALYPRFISSRTIPP
jgi:hypothetical protein